MASKLGASQTYSPGSGLRKPRQFFKDQDWVRGDGRLFHQCRPAFLRTGAVNAASGSAYAEFGNTKVIVSVFGPRESKKAMMYSDIGRLNCNVSFTTFSTQVRGQGSDHKEFSAMLHKALEGAIMLETFPKTTVDVFALVLESGGSDLPVVISCASLALADAGIMMFDLVSSASVSCLGKSLIIDPTLEEESFQDGSFMITYMPSRNEVTQLTLTGEWSTAKIAEVIYDKLTGRSRGFGFVTMSTVEEVEAAAQQFNGYEFEGRALRVNSGPPPQRDDFSPRTPRVNSFDSPNRVYVGNLSWGVDDLALETLFSEQGKVMEARVVYDRESGRSRGFGFVTYSSAEEVDSAISSLNGTDLNGRAIRVTPAEAKPRRQF